MNLIVFRIAFFLLVPIAKVQNLLRKAKDLIRTVNACACAANCLMIVKGPRLEVQSTNGKLFCFLTVEV